jgi:hypothetical protein
MRRRRPLCATEAGPFERIRTRRRHQLAVSGAGRAGESLWAGGPHSFPLTVDEQTTPWHRGQACGAGCCFNRIPGHPLPLWRPPKRALVRETLTQRCRGHHPALQAYRSTPVVDSDSETAAGLVADEPEDTDVLGDSAYPSELRDHLQRANHGYFGCGTLGIDV